MTIPKTEYIAGKKSAPLTKEEHKKLIKYRKNFGSELMCAEAIGIGRSALNRILIVGSGHPDNIEKIKTMLHEPSND